VIPARIENPTVKLGAPRDWDEERDGKCVGLWVRAVDGVFSSAWEPTPAELEALNAGAHVILHVVGGQPAVMLEVGKPPE
jgi:hypothetical protein